MDKEEKPKRRLNAKQIKLVNGIAEGKTIGQSALDAGFGKTIESARATGSVQLRKINESGLLDEALDKAGVTLEHAANAIKQGYNANKRDQADYNTRLKTAEIHLKAKRILGQNESSMVQNNFIGTDSFEEFCRAYHKTRT